MLPYLRDQRDWVYSLETEIFFYWVSIWDRDQDFFLVVSTTRLRFFFQSLNFETEIETSFFKSRDRDIDRHWSQNQDRDFSIHLAYFKSLS